MKRIILAALAAAALSAPAAFAQTNPALMDWNDARRFSAGAQAGYRWLAESNYAFDKEWMIGGTAQWALGQKSSLRAAAQYGFDNRITTPSIGWHLDLGHHPATGPASYGATLGHQWVRSSGGRPVPHPAKDEFFTGVAVAWPISENGTIGGGADYGLASGIIATRIVLSVHFHP